ncbi:MAG TPA: lipopolysaccharide kinase InaA family protein [Syntrophorhabdaceae bacterium]|nr:lipopolysaccharide kinase InaA family protein [Syntrophorhabdaceae bacterium]
MKHLRIKGIDWFLEKDLLDDFLNTIELKATYRRDYRIIQVNDNRYFFKFFREKGLSGVFRRSINPRAKKEFLMGKRLLSFGINTPEPFGYGVSKDGSFIIQRCLYGKNFIDAFYEQENKKERIIQLAMLLKKMEAYKIRHNDLHLNNIIVEDNKLYLIDLHKMEIKKHFSLSDKVSNLSHSLAMVYQDMSEDEKETFFLTYGSPNIRKIVESTLTDMWKKWIEKKKKRAFKDTSIVKNAKDILYIKDSQWQRQEVFKEIIKQDKKTVVCRYSDHIRKSYRNKRRLKKAWEAYVVLSYMSLKVTPQVFFIKLPGIIQPGFMAMEDLKGRGEELDRFLDRQYNQMDLKKRALFIERLSVFLKCLFKKSIFHKDFKACNIFVKEDGSFLLLDMEDIVFKSANEEDLIKMFIQLNTTIPKYIKHTDRMRFFLKMIEGLEVNKKKSARRIAKASSIMDIVYEGIDGLKFKRFR